MRIKCHYSSNGIDVDSTASFAIITFDTVKYLNGDIDTLISRFNVPDIDRLPNDSLYRWCKNGCLLTRVDTNGKQHQFVYPGKEKYKDGVFEYELPYPALLIVNAIKVDAVKDSLDSIIDYVRYTGTTQVELKENETVNKSILMVRTN